MATQNWVNIGSGYGLLPLPEPMLTYYQRYHYSDVIMSAMTPSQRASNAENVPI